jgi:predicted RNA-binding Zn ribbon-like protein
VVLAASELLTSDEMARVKRCPGCGWLFLDTSRNGMRRWCSMEDCGSEAKSKRQYERKRAEKSPAGY